MKIVSIQTIGEPWLLHNYGSFFQHYALRVLIKSFGYEVCRLPDNRLREKIAILKAILLFFHSYLKCLLGKGRMPVFTKRERLGTECKDKFQEEYQSLIGLFRERRRKNTYAYIAGGDCIWYAVAPYAYFLGREYNPAAKRIAFGASSDWENVRDNAKWRSYIMKAGETFTGVGVREEIGAKICQSLMPRQKVMRVVDPVFLLNKNHYLELSSKKTFFSKPTLFYYAVNSRGADLNIDNILTASSALRMDCKVVGIQGSERDIPRDLLLMPSPTEFLSCVRDCDAFITNSFHGIVFALILNKRFVFLKQKAKIGFNKNRRQTELLTRLNLMSQALEMNATGEEISSALEREINWDEVNHFIDKDRNDSIEWLKGMLQ